MMKEDMVLYSRDFLVLVKTIPVRMVYKVGSDLVQVLMSPLLGKIVAKGW